MFDRVFPPRLGPLLQREGTAVVRSASFIASAWSLNERRMRRPAVVVGDFPNRVGFRLVSCVMAVYLHRHVAGFDGFRLPAFASALGEVAEWSKATVC